ncbi:Protein kinase domain-containing protein [Mycena sanguinolenta]|uniref:Protein kinase domain-containing protein n=1 Tax=Mycena sanguinolenta TaxID=230812 RepID=A0A8H7CU68_9AGAR|nr:Protein kinase domain-containing protein [Mycena sanguinolenta]
MDSPQQEGSTDVFSISDQVLSDKLQFVEEIGYGNWGSVWLCRPKEDPDSPSADGLVRLQETKIAVKLVHRSKTSTTAARVRSLWNEMKIVRSFKSDPHPSIIPFHSFIITPSYALITMAFLPTLVPVEVDESKAREWFRFLLSGVEFLHKRGVVHNDIKPANILLSTKNIPVLVDFGFAERYDMKSSTAFHSNLSYGTPEYLSPERARGLPHDTRKSDVWSLGITFFEILIGRTPFEHSDSEQFSTKEDLEKYWARTLRGKWVGTWKMSKTMEKLLRRMISPNADLRCTATDAMSDPCWRDFREVESSHRRSSSYNSSIVFQKDMSKIGSPVSPWSTNAKENRSPPGLDSSFSKEERSLTKSKSQPKVTSSKIQVQARKRVPAPPMVDLSPIKGSPPSSPPATSAQQNVRSLASLTTGTTQRQPLGVLSPRTRQNLPQPKPAIEPKDSRKVRPLAELTANRTTTKERGKHDSVKDRVREWEREKERLREMERLDELERDRDAQREAEREQAERQQRALAARERARDKENHNADASDILSPPRPVAPPPTPEVSRAEVSLPSITSPSPGGSNSYGIHSFKHSVKLSFDKTLQLMAQATSRNVSSRTLGENPDDTVSRRSPSIGRESWEDEAFERDVKSSLPVVRHAVHNEQVAADNRIDRMAIWMRNVEQVVDEARQNFASSSREVAPLPPLPLAPLSRAGSHSRAASQANNTYRSSRLPRRVLAASQIFADLPADSSLNTSVNAAASSTVANADISGATSPTLSRPRTPTRQRRATVSVPGPADASFDLDAETGSPSKRKEKSKSHAALLERRITPVAQLELEISKRKKFGLFPVVIFKLSLPAVEPPASPRLSQVLDRSLFVASPVRRTFDEEERSHTVERSFDELTSSPYHVEPYPARKANAPVPVPDSPSLRRLEGVYDRFLMATTGVKRVGKGYQSDNAGPVSYTIGPNTPAPRNPRAFLSARRAMRPPISSEDSNRNSVSVDELGVMTYAGPGTTSPREGNTTITLVRRAFKAFVPGNKTVSRRLSRHLN